MIALNIWENGSFRKREHLQRLKTVDLVSFNLTKRINGKCNSFDAQIPGLRGILFSVKTQFSEGPEYENKMIKWA